MLERRMVDPQQVRQFRMFRNLDDALVEEVRQHARIITLRAKEPLFRQREPIHRVQFCLSGRIKLFRLNRLGGEKIFAIASVGDTVLDSMSMDHERRYPLDCAAIVASEVMSIETDFLIDLFDRSRLARSDLVMSLITRADELIDHVELLSVDKASYRVATFLYEEYLRNGRAPTFRLPSSKKHIAIYLSLQPETLSRCLKALRADGIVKSNARDIEILDPEALAELVIGSRAEV
jgi:CRP/FNR family transcriptional regulator